MEKLTRWCLRAMTTDEGKRAVAGWVSFRMPEGVDYANLVPIRIVAVDGVERLANGSGVSHPRDGFHAHRPAHVGAREVLGEINYCVLLPRPRRSDSCSTGLPGRRTADKGIQENPLGIPLEGCPLDEQISEMHSLRKRGDARRARSRWSRSTTRCARARATASATTA
ncbi:MAG: hypothetical protein MZU91_08490 [Desulfosudis oleivorans]|nr:hypothetical protein [Desulfosudis oleivorans]